MGVQLFQGDYVDESGVPLQENFDSLPHAMLSLYVLLSTENYPDVMYPALQASWWNFWYFFTFIIISIYMFLNVLVAMIFDTYRRHHKDLVHTQRMQRIVALAAAFECIDIDNNGQIDFEEWCALMGYYFSGEATLDSSSASPQQINSPAPTSSGDLTDVAQLPVAGTAVQTILSFDERMKLKVLFDTVDTDGDGSLSLTEFLSLLDVMMLDVEVHNDFKRTRVSCQEWKLWDRHCLRLRRVVESNWFEGFITLLIIGNLILMAFYTTNIDDATLAVLEVLDAVFLSLFVAEAVLKLVGLGVRRYFRSPWNRFDFIIVMFGVAFQIALQASSVAGLKAFRVARLARLLRASRALRALRLTSVVQRLRLVAFAFIRTMPVLASMSWLTGALMYSLSVIGMEMFGTSHASLPDDAQFADEIATFETFYQSALTIFQVFTTSNWHEIMYRYMEAYSPYSAWFFVISFFLLELVVTNVLIAIIIEVYTSTRERLLNAEVTDSELDEGNAATDTATATTFSDGSVEDNSDEPESQDEASDGSGGGQRAEEADDTNDGYDEAETDHRSDYFDRTAAGTPDGHVPSESKPTIRATSTDSAEHRGARTGCKSGHSTSSQPQLLARAASGILTPVPSAGPLTKQPRSVQLRHMLHASHRAQSLASQRLLRLTENPVNTQPPAVTEAGSSNVSVDGSTDDEDPCNVTTAMTNAALHHRRRRSMQTGSMRSEPGLSRPAAPTLHGQKRKSLSYSGTNPMHGATVEVAPRPYVHIRRRRQFNTWATGWERTLHQDSLQSLKLETELLAGYGLSAETLVSSISGAQQRLARRSMKTVLRSKVHAVIASNAVHNKAQAESRKPTTTTAPSGTNSQVAQSAMTGDVTSTLAAAVGGQSSQSATTGATNRFRSRVKAMLGWQRAKSKR